MLSRNRRCRGRTAPARPAYRLPASESASARTSSGASGARASIAASHLRPSVIRRYPRGATTITWTATDAASNTATGTQIVTVRDAEKPQVTAPTNLIVSADPGKCTAVVSNAALGNASTSDNCPGVVVARSGGPSGSVFPLGVTTLTYHVTFRGGETCDVTQNADTAFYTSPTRGNWTSKNVWCPTLADAGKTITLYGLYRNASGATIQDTVIVHVSRERKRGRAAEFGRPPLTGRGGSGEQAIASDSGRRVR